LAARRCEPTPDAGDAQGGTTYQPGDPGGARGTTHSRINQFMNKFRKLGLIEYNGELKVHSSLLNVVTGHQRI
jgi:hypothetical protein